MKKILSLLLCLCLLVGLVPGMGTSAFAAGSYNIGDTVTFAGYDWDIIGTESEGVTAPEGYYTLFAKNNDFGSTAFRAGASNADSTANHYKDSDLQKKMEEIAEKYNKTTAQLLLRWNIQQGIIPIPKSKNEQRLQHNIDVFDFEITKEDMEELNHMNENHRTSFDPLTFDF